jgi:hypothetical protein
VIVATRTYFGNDAFNAWAWRVPFLVPFLLVAIAIAMSAVALLLSLFGVTGTS